MEVARALKRKREEKQERKEMQKKERFLEDFLFGSKVCIEIDPPYRFCIFTLLTIGFKLFLGEKIW